MCVVIIPREPRVGTLDINSQFFVQFTPKRGERQLAALDLAAGEFPVAGIDLARRPLAEKKAAVLALDDCGRDLDPLCGHRLWQEG